MLSDTLLNAMPQRLMIFMLIWAWTAMATASDKLAWDVFSDTWVATDTLGRSLPTQTEVGPPRPDKQVGIFYFLWLGRHGQAGPFDIQKILAEAPAAIDQPDHALWGPLHAPHHWGESVFGYYVGEDESVLAKHAQMLADAGVDAVIFDVTNQLTYPESWRALCRVWDRIRLQGQRVPRIAFLCPFWDPAKVVRELHRDLYGAGRYSELWYRREGKPLILADPSLLEERFGNEEHDTAVRLEPGHTLGQSFHTTQPLRSVAGCFPTWRTSDASLTLTLRRAGPGGEVITTERFTSVTDNAWLALVLDPPAEAGEFYLEAVEGQGRIGWWSHSQDRLPRGSAFIDRQPAPGDRQLRWHGVDPELEAIRECFTFRKPQPDYFRGPTGPDQWGWLEVYPQHPFTNRLGQVEEVTVGVAQNAVDGQLSVLSNPRAHGRSYHKGGQPPPGDQDFTGRNASEQWARALALDPSFVFVTGWNEWIAGRFTAPSGFYGDGPVTFVDQFNREYSRDIEPLRGGHGDAFYYQLVDYVRRFKGARGIVPVAASPIGIDGVMDDWSAVQPEFRDTLGDPVQRDAPAWDRRQRFTNDTGRNDLVSAKVSHDGCTLFFLVRTREPLTPATDPRWMQLYLDVDQNPTNGWCGYDFVVNREPPDTTSARLERHDGPGYHWVGATPVPSAQGSRALELAIPLQALGLSERPVWIDFKWADNAIRDGDPSEFTTRGDAAPNDRFNYRALF